MKIGVLGSGLMGKEAARDLVTSSDVVAVGIADIQMDLAKRLSTFCPPFKLKPIKLMAGTPKHLPIYIRNSKVIIISYFILFMKQLRVPQQRSVSTRSI